MAMKRLILPLFILGALVGSTYAQDRKPTRQPVIQPTPSRPSYRPMPSRTPSRPAPSVSRQGSTRTPGPVPASRTNRPVPSYPGSRGNGSTNGTPQGGGGYSNPVPSYTPGYEPSWYSWNYVNLFFNRLYSRYPILYSDSYLWRYSLADSPLSAEDLSAALSRPVAAAGAMHRLSASIVELVQDYQAGQLGASEFRLTLRQRTETVRKLAKAIRKDDLLDLLDMRKDSKAPKYSKAEDVSTLLALAEKLQQTVLALESGLQRYASADMTRTVELSHFEGLSFDSLSKMADDLAKTIEKSSRKL